jgi:hypothetical protein
VPDTNLRVCHGSSADVPNGVIACPGTPDDDDCSATDYCGQDAQYGWDLKEESSARFTVEGDSEGVVRDNLTGLDWQTCSAGQSGADCSGTATLGSWHDSVSYCQDLEWGGHDDWRLPDSYEMHGIVDFSTYGPALDTSVFPNPPNLFPASYDNWWIDCGWTSTIDADPSVSLALMLNSGDISAGSGLEYHVHDQDAEGWDGCSTRCIRGGGEMQHQRFIPTGTEGEPVLIDTWGERIWQGCSAGQSGDGCDGEATMMDWKSSLSYCQDLEWGGSEGWRLPDVKELMSIVDFRVQQPAIDGDLFPNTPHYGMDFTNDDAGRYWSSTSRNDNDFALYVDFSFGSTHFYLQSIPRHVRCMR